MKPKVVRKKKSARRRSARKSRVSESVVKPVVIHAHKIHQAPGSVTELRPWVRSSIIGGGSFIITFITSWFALNGFFYKPAIPSRRVGDSLTMQSITHDREKYIDADSIMNRLQTDPQSIVLIDLRTDKEFRSGHIAQAVNIPDFSADTLQLLAMKYSAKSIVLYAQSNHSNEPHEAFGLMKQFEDVRILSGGWEEWKKSYK